MLLQLLEHKILFLVKSTDSHHMVSTSVPLGYKIYAARIALRRCQACGRVMIARLPPLIDTTPGLTALRRIFYNLSGPLVETIWPLRGYRRRRS
jgi:hypothetical protein